MHWNQTFASLLPPYLNEEVGKYISIYSHDSQWSEFSLRNLYQCLLPCPLQAPQILTSPLRPPTTSQRPPLCLLIFRPDPNPLPLAPIRNLVSQHANSGLNVMISPMMAHTSSSPTMSRPVISPLPFPRCFQCCTNLHRVILTSRLFDPSRSYSAQWRS